MHEAPRPVSVIIPAHNESRRIGLLLDALTQGHPAPEQMEVLVVCNGCTDNTAELARGFSGVQVIEIPEPSKRLALAAGDARAHRPFRAYVDGDVVISSADLSLLLDALEPPALVSAPTRQLDVSGASLIVRWYYDVWNQLPAVTGGVFGRGVIVMTPEGHARIGGLPRVMSDDLAISEAFGTAERVIVPGAVVTIAVPRRIGDLLRRRIRVVTGNVQLDQLTLRSGDARTRPADLLRIAVSGPLNPLKVGVFLVVTAAARLMARRRVKAGDFTTWLRDDSSRA